MTWKPKPPWSDHPRYPASDWQDEVAEEVTRQSYIEWVNSRLEEEASCLLPEDWRHEVIRILETAMPHVNTLNEGTGLDLRTTTLREVIDDLESLEEYKPSQRQPRLGHRRSAHVAAQALLQ